MRNLLLSAPANVSRLVHMQPRYARGKDLRIDALYYEGDQKARHDAYRKPNRRLQKLLLRAEGFRS